MHFYQQTVDIINSQGLDGISLKNFWRLTEYPKTNFALKIDDDSKELLWDMLKDSKKIQVYTVPEPIPDLPVYDRLEFYQVTEETSFFIPLPYKTGPIHLINKNDILGCTNTFETRKVMSKKERMTLSKEDRERIADSIILVSMQRERDKFIIGQGISSKDIGVISYYILELLARNRENGLTSTGSLSLVAYGFTSSQIHFARKILESRGLIFTQPYLERGKEESNKSVLYLHYRFKKIFPYYPALMLEKISNFLETKPGKSEFLYKIKKEFKIRQKVMKIIRNYSNKFGTIISKKMHLNDAITLIHPNLVDSEKRSKLQSEILDNDTGQDSENEDLTRQIIKGVKKNSKSNICSVVILNKKFDYLKWEENCLKTKEYTWNEDEFAEQIGDDKMDLEKEANLDEPENSIIGDETNMSYIAGTVKGMGGKHCNSADLWKNFGYIPKINSQEPILEQIYSFILREGPVSANYISKELDLDNAFIRPYIFCLSSKKYVKATKFSIGNSTAYFYEVVGNRNSNRKEQNLTQRAIRAQTVLECLKEFNGACDIYSTRKYILKKEFTCGYSAKMDRKSFNRVVGDLIGRKEIQIISVSMRTKKKVDVLTLPGLDIESEAVKKAIRSWNQDTNSSNVGRAIFHDYTESKDSSPLERKETMLIKDKNSLIDLKTINDPVWSNVVINKNDMVLVNVSDKLTPKFKRRQVIHQFLWYVTRVMKYPASPLRFDEEVGLNIYKDEFTWRRYLPACETDDLGWFDIFDAISLMPLGLYLNIVMKDLVPLVLFEWIGSMSVKERPSSCLFKLFEEMNLTPEQDARRKFDLLCTPLKKLKIPGGISGTLATWLLSRKNYSQIQRILDGLSIQNLISLKHNVNAYFDCYMHQYATIIDTRNCSPGKNLIFEFVDAEAMYFQLSSEESVERYWITLQTICINTRLGQRLLIEEPLWNRKITSNPNILKNKEFLCDSGEIIYDTNYIMIPYVHNRVKVPIRKHTDMPSSYKEDHVWVYLPCSAGGLHPTEFSFIVRNWYKTLNKEKITDINETVNEKSDCNVVDVEGNDHRMSTVLSRYEIINFFDNDQRLNMIYPNVSEFMWPWFNSLGTDLLCSYELPPVKPLNEAQRNELSKKLENEANKRRKQPKRAKKAVGDEDTDYEENLINSDIDDAEQFEPRKKRVRIEEPEYERKRTSMRTRSSPLKRPKLADLESNNEPEIKSSSDDDLSLDSDEADYYEKLESAVKKKKSSISKEDEIDRKIRKVVLSSRISWTSEEDMILLLAHCASVLVDGIRRIPIAVPYEIVRNYLMVYCPIIEPKMTKACQRRLKFLIRNRNKMQVLYMRTLSMPIKKKIENILNIPWRSFLIKQREKAIGLFEETLDTLIREFMPNHKKLYPSAEEAMRVYEEKLYSEKIIFDGLPSTLQTNLGNAATDDKKVQSNEPKYFMKLASIDEIAEEMNNFNIADTVTGSKLLTSNSKGMKTNVIIAVLTNYIMSSFKVIDHDRELDEVIFNRTIQQYPLSNIKMAIDSMHKKNIICLSRKNNDETCFRRLGRNYVKFSVRQKLWIRIDFCTLMKYHWEFYDIIRELPLEKKKLENNFHFTHDMSEQVTGGQAAFFAEIFPDPFFNIDIAFSIQDIHVMSNSTLNFSKRFKMRNKMKNIVTLKNEVNSDPEETSDGGLSSENEIFSENRDEIDEEEIQFDEDDDLEAINVIRPGGKLYEKNRITSNARSRRIDNLIKLTGGTLKITTPDFEAEQETSTAFFDQITDSLKEKCDAILDRVMNQRLPWNPSLPLNSSHVNDDSCNFDGLREILSKRNDILKDNNPMEKLLIQFISKEADLGRTGQEIFKEFGGTLETEEALSSLLKANKIFMVGYDERKYVYKDYLRLWIVHIKAGQKSITRRQITMNSDKDYYFIPEVWLNEFGELLPKMFMNLVTAVMSNVSNYAGIDVQGLAQQFTRLTTPYSIFRILLILQEIGCIEMTHYQDDKPANLFSKFTIKTDKSLSIAFGNLNQIHIMPKLYYHLRLYQFVDSVSKRCGIPCQLALPKFKINNSSAKESID